METPPTDANQPLPVDTGRGLSLSYRGRYLLSSRDPQEHCRKILNQFGPEEGTLYFLPSPLFGYHLDTWVQTWGPGCHGVFLELEEALKAFIPEVSGPSFSLLHSDDDSSLISLLDTLDIGRFRRVRMVSLSGGISLHTGRYQAVLDQLETEIRIHWQNRSTLMVMAPLFLKNIFQNLKYLQSQEFFSLPARLNRPVIVLGAGESLETLITELPHQRERVFLLAADTALQPLAEAGIFPDAVTVLESQYHNLADFVGLPWGRMELWADLTCHPLTLRLPWKTRRIFLSRFAPVSLLDRLRTSGIPLVLPRGSVGLTALELAMGLSGAALGISGLDFSFRPGKSHSRGAPALKSRLKGATRLQSLESPPEAGTVPVATSRPEWVTTKVLREYGRTARDMVNNCPGTLWDLRAGGIDLGLERKTLKEFLSGSQPAAAVSSPEISRPWDAGKILKAEEMLLEKIWEDFKTLNRTGVLPEEFPGHLAAADYLTAAFPDRDRVDLKSGTSLSRIKAALAYYWRYLKD